MDLLYWDIWNDLIFHTKENENSRVLLNQILCSPILCCKKKKVIQTPTLYFTRHYLQLTDNLLTSLPMFLSYSQSKKQKTKNQSESLGCSRRASSLCPQTYQQRNQLIVTSRKGSSQCTPQLLLNDWYSKHTKKDSVFHKISSTEKLTTGQPNWISFESGPTFSVWSAYYIGMKTSL